MYGDTTMRGSMGDERAARPSSGWAFLVLYKAIQGIRDLSSDVAGVYLPIIAQAVRPRLLCHDESLLLHEV
jgi:hypothetical protein